ncbi:MAG: TonB-dependent receptor [Luteitalea sp.]|nr:TonB-dependent receptor [Luteitalea sp.]
MDGHRVRRSGRSEGEKTMHSKLTVRLGAAALATALALVPGTASAQQASSIAGVVRDTSGAVLPGVTVEAASPALIEKVRTVVTDGEGRYNVTDLRPGTYVVTFTLTGFNTFRRDGITLTTGFTASVNADMQVGALEETITVSGAAPLVDTQNVRQQAQVSAELLAALPSGAKGIVALAKLVPGMTTGTDVGGGGVGGIYQANQTTSAGFHGKGSPKDSYDGMQVNNLSGIGSTGYIMNPATVAEATVSTGGVSAESDSSGISVNMVPKEGGNVFRFGVDATYSNDGLQRWDNRSDTLRAVGLPPTNTLRYAYDTNVTLGGPVKRDRLWFFVATRFTGTQNSNPGRYFTKNLGAITYTPDIDRPAYYQDWLKGQGGRLTWQVSPRNKINVFADIQTVQTRGTGANTAPEAHTCYVMWPQGLYQASWSSPVTSKFLLEAGASRTQAPFPCTREDRTDIFGFSVSPTDISVLESSTGFRYNAASSYLYLQDMDRYAQRFSATYVTGSHSFKVGMQLQQHVHDRTDVVNGDVTYTLNRGVPTRITQFATPYTQMNRTKADLSLYAQDQWAIKRLTINYGLRFDYYNGYVPAEHVDAGQFVGVRDFAAVNDVPNWKDLNPRLGGSYDLFGTGRTALKVSLGRYSGKESVSVAQFNNPVTTSVNSTNRSWTDANGNYIPDCQLTNFAANGECGATDSVNFGKVNPNAVRFADGMIRGWGKRDYLWDFGTEVQHEIRPGTSVTAGYYRNWSSQYRELPRGDFSSVGVTDNLAVTPADYSPFCITAPLDARLPGGGGYQVCGLYDIAPAKFGAGDLLIARASEYGDGKSRVSQFVTGSVNTRFAGIELGASVDTGRIVEDRCFVVDSPQELLNCRVVTPFKGQTRLKLHGVYPLPGGVTVSGVFEGLPGSPYEANYEVSNAEVAPSLGRNLAACGTRVVCTSSVTVPLFAPQTLFQPRRTLLDLRLSKRFEVGPGRSLRANLDVYNVLNDGSILTTNNNYGSQWLLPSGGILAARTVQIGGQLSF